MKVGMISDHTYDDITQIWTVYHQNYKSRMASVLKVQFSFNYKELIFFKFNV
jgi:hypothetical protein